MVNALGGFIDFQLTDEGNPNIDWNPVWDSSVGRFDGGWTVEMAIPFKSIRFRPGAEQLWGVQLGRHVSWKNERTYLNPVPISGGPGEFRVSGRGHSDGPRGAGGQPDVRDEALRHRRAGQRHRQRHPQRRHRRRRHRRQVRRHREPDRGLHLQHRLRAGRGGRAAGQPHALQPLLPREARLLPRGPGHLRLRARRVLRRRRRGRRRPPDRRRRRLLRGRRRPDHLLQPADRAPAAGRGQPHRADPRRRAAHGPGRSVQHRCAGHRHRERGYRRGRADRFHRAPREPRRPAPQPDRRHLHRPLGIAQRPRLERGLRRRRAVRLLRQRVRERLLRRVANGRARGRRRQLPGSVHVQRRPLCDAARPPARRLQLQSGDGLPAAGGFPPHVRHRQLRPPAPLLRVRPAVHLRRQPRLHRDRRGHGRDPHRAAPLPDRIRERRSAGGRRADAATS